MGNQGFAAAIAHVQGESGLHFGQIILAAPDLSPETFQAVADEYHRMSTRTTLYVSSRDLALRTSEWLNDAPRIGYTPPVEVVPGIDTIEVTDIDLTMLGHSYFAEAEGVLYVRVRRIQVSRAPATVELGGADQARAAAQAHGVSDAMSEALVVESLPSTSSM